MECVKSQEVLSLLNHGLRRGGRLFSDFRDFSIEIEMEGESLVVSLGKTRVLVQLLCSEMVPTKERPSEGKLSFHFSTENLNEFTKLELHSGALQNQFRELGESLEELIHGSGALHLQSLCVLLGLKAYRLQLFFEVISFDGGLRDTCSFAAIAVLRHFRRCGNVPDCRIPLVNQPFYCTFAVFAEEGRPKALIVSDPDGDELFAKPAVISVGVNSEGDLCSLWKSGAVATSSEIIQLLMPIAISRAKILNKVVNDSVEL